MPEEFKKYFERVKNLKFSEDPDYDNLRLLFSKFVNNFNNFIPDWGEKVLKYKQISAKNKESFEYKPPTTKSKKKERICKTSEKEVKNPNINTANYLKSRKSFVPQSSLFCKIINYKRNSEKKIIIQSEKDSPVKKKNNLSSDYDESLGDDKPINQVNAYKGLIPKVAKKLM